MGVIRKFQGAGSAGGGSSIAAQKYISGQKYSAAGTRATATRPNGQQTFIPINIESAITIAALTAEVTSAASAGGVLRLGIYADNNGRPGNLLLDAGATAVATAVGLTGVTGLNFAAAVGRYWLSAAPQGAPTTVATWRTFGPNNTVIAGSPIAVASNLANGGGWAKGGITGAFANADNTESPADTTILVAFTPA